MSSFKAAKMHQNQNRAVKISSHINMTPLTPRFCAPA